MSIWIFTGESSLSSEESDLVQDKLDWLLRHIERDDVIVTGAAYGVDSKVGLWAADNLPGLQQFVYVPAAHHNERAVATMSRAGVRVIRVDPPYSEAAASQCYMARNTAMVGHGPASDSILIAFPRIEGERLRSGTWATVRRARKREGMDILICSLEKMAKIPA